MKKIQKSGINRFKVFFVFITLIVISGINAQVKKDSLVFKNGNFMVGEIKSLDQGVLVVETKYSDSDFKIDWDHVKEIYTKFYKVITLANNRVYYGTLSMQLADTILITTDYADSVVSKLEDIVNLETVKKEVKNRFSALIDIGSSLAKSENLIQLNVRADLGYKTEEWSLKSTYNSLRSDRDYAEEIHRSEVDLSFNLKFRKGWYSTASISFLSNTEQKLKLRTNGLLALGKFLIRTRAFHWGIQLGANRNREDYSNNTPDRDSWEGYLGTRFKIYNMDNIELDVKIDAYPGITAKERFRGDAGLDAKIDIISDFFIRLGFLFNYDNIPADDAPDFDYVLTTSFGWEW